MKGDAAATELLVLRAAALLTTAGTILFLFIGDDWRLSNMFLVPDLIVCAILTWGAVATSRTARLILLLGFAVGIGVFSAASASYLVDARLGIGAAIALLTCVAGTARLLGSALRTAG